MAGARTRSRDAGMPAAPTASPTIPVYLLFGDDEYLVAEHGRRIYEGLCPPDSRMFGAEEINGQAETAERATQALRQCLIAVRTPGLVGDRKVVWFRGVSFLKKADIVNHEAVRPWLDELTRLIKSGLPQGHHLVITARAADGRSAFVKACEAAGLAVAFSLPEKSWQASGHAQERAGEALREAGLRADSETLALFADRTGLDTRTIYSEAAKMQAYLGDRNEVTPADVREITSPSRESAAWDLAERVAGRDLRGALDVFRRLMFQREEPIWLINLLEARFREMAVLRDARERGWVRPAGRLVEWTPDPQAEQALSALDEWDPRRMHPFKAGVLLGQAARYSGRELARAMRDITRVREQMVSGFSSPELLLELLVIRLAGARPAQQAVRNAEVNA